MRMNQDPSDADRSLIEMINECLNTRSRVIARIVTRIYDEAFAAFGIDSVQFSLLGAVYHLASATRTEIGRFLRLDRSTLTRTLQPLLDRGLIQEIPAAAAGRRRPIGLTEAGRGALLAVVPVWRSAQLEVKALLEEDGSAAVKKVGDEILFPTR
jgi:DNA-binding MarR family transcriptional regulator